MDIIKHTHTHRATILRLHQQARPLRVLLRNRMLEASVQPGGGQGLGSGFCGGGWDDPGRLM